MRARLCTHAFFPGEQHIQYSLFGLPRSVSTETHQTLSRNGATGRCNRHHRAAVVAQAVGRQRVVRRGHGGGPYVQAESWLREKYRLTVANSIGCKSVCIGAPRVAGETIASGRSLVFIFHTQSFRCRTSQATNSGSNGTTHPPASSDPLRQNLAIQVGSWAASGVIFFLPLAPESHMSLRQGSRSAWTEHSWRQDRIVGEGGVRQSLVTAPEAVVFACFAHPPAYHRMRTLKSR